MSHQLTPEVLEAIMDTFDVSAAEAVEMYESAMRVEER